MLQYVNEFSQIKQIAKNQPNILSTHYQVRKIGTGQQPISRICSDLLLIIFFKFRP